jgi:hypothetical protein
MAREHAQNVKRIVDALKAGERDEVVGHPKGRGGERV